MPDRALHRELACLGHGAHLCLLYDNDEDQLISMDFVRIGLGRGDRCFYIADDTTTDRAASALGATFDLPDAKRRGALQVHTQREAYLRSGTFDPGAMIALLGEATDAAVRDGFAGLTITGEMTWAIGADVPPARLIEYEARLNHFFPGSRAAAICQYDLRRFPAHLIEQVLRTHPLAIVGRTVCENLYYEPPDHVLGAPSKAQQVRWMIDQLREAKRRERERERAVAVSEERFRAFFDNAPLGKCVTLPDGRLARVNPRLCEMLGYAPEELSAIDWMKITHPDDVPESRECVRALLAGERASWKMEKRYVARDGRLVWAYVTTRLSRDTDGRPEYFLTHIEDITDRKRVEEELRRYRDELEHRVAERTAELRAANDQLAAANKELEAFAYSVSHDLRAPLRAIAGFSQALLREQQDRLDATGREYLERCVGAAHRMGALIDDLLELSRVTRKEMVSEPIDLSQVAREVLADLQKADPGRQVETRVADGITAWGDRGLLRLLLDNLLGNAWKFTSKKDRARIEFTTESRDGQPVHLVRDDGAGFDMRYAGKLFAPFQRLHKTTDFPGTGIGLATAQRIVARHGGRIWADAQRDGGATLFFTLARGGSHEPQQPR